ncbi:hypothetical protein RMHFA_05697 [Roseomonas mucosa]|uniref:hypothetical protein n=1 Tax=Roseomonas sp. FDAARGOS_362 TaxID=2018065 RepID=UPI00125FA747|nr:hypothetical protein [Roseomonas sp. FDAARGOS_362]UZO95773.1 hypothetical protein RMHFA_05697 [Roseomonas mucosa]
MFKADYMAEGCVLVGDDRRYRVRSVQAAEGGDDALIVQGVHRDHSVSDSGPELAKRRVRGRADRGQPAVTCANLERRALPTFVEIHEHILRHADA